MLNLFFVLLFAVPGFSQGGRVTILGAPSEPEAKVQEAAPQPAASQPEDRDVDELAQRNKEAQEKQAKNAARAAEIKTLPLTDKRSLEFMKERINDGSVEAVTPEEMKKEILERSKGHFLEPVLREFPTLVDLAVKILRSKPAMLGIISILEQQKVVKTYTYLLIGLCIFNLMLRSRMIPPRMPFFQRLAYTIPINIFTTSIGLMLFYFFFGEEFGPTFSIIIQHFFN